jgi:hypothetical protein
MDALNIPKSYDVNSNVQSNKIAASSPVQPISQSAQIKPLGNNSEISILKQWKRITELGKDGIPLNFNDVLVIQYLADGTYKTKQVTKEGEFIEGTGRYQLLKDNSIIVYLMDNGKTYSAVIKKLTNSELEIKSDDYHTFFMVY